MVGDRTQELDLFNHVVYSVTVGEGFFACASGRGRRPEFQHSVTQVHQLQLKYMGAIHPDLSV